MDIQATKLELMELLLLTEEEAILKQTQAIFKAKDLNKEEHIDIPQWQKDETLNRLEKIKDGTVKTRSWDASAKEIFNK